MVTAADPLTLLSTAGALAGGGDAGLGAGVDVDSITKNTQAYIATATVTADGNVLVAGHVGREPHLGHRGGRYQRQRRDRRLGRRLRPGDHHAGVHRRRPRQPDLRRHDRPGRAAASWSRRRSRPCSTSCRATSPAPARRASGRRRACRSSPRRPKPSSGPGPTSAPWDWADAIEAENGQFAISYAPYGTSVGVVAAQADQCQPDRLGQQPRPSPRLGQERIATPETQSVNGLAVTAVNSDAIQGVGVDGGVSGTVAVNLSGSVAVLTNHTDAYIGSGAAINASNSGASDRPVGPGRGRQRHVVPGHCRRALDLGHGQHHAGGRRGGDQQHDHGGDRRRRLGCRRWATSRSKRTQAATSCRSPPPGPSPARPPWAGRSRTSA